MLNLYTFDHAALHSEALRELFAGISPIILFELDYTYKNVINNIQSRYRALNGYQKTLLSRNETRYVLDALLAIDSSQGLYTPDAIGI